MKSVIGKIGLAFKSTSKTVKATIIFLAWIFLGLLIYALEIENESITGWWVFFLIVFMGLLSGYLKEHGHDRIHPKHEYSKDTDR